MNKKSVSSYQSDSFNGVNQQMSVSDSLRQLLVSLSNEQRRNQELLVSLGFVLYIIDVLQEDDLHQVIF